MRQAEVKKAWEDFRRRNQSLAFLPTAYRLPPVEMFGLLIRFLQVAIFCCVNCLMPVLISQE